MKVQEYVTTDDIRVRDNMLPAGSFVKPIVHAWLPKHITGTNEYIMMDKAKFVHVYCRYGIVAIDRSFIRELK